ncbi:MAG TPA: trimeric intracellular cation channel family protein [bacterium]|nr:trimeric intracellular cation channel family protein [bacterium]HOL35101.1 trimeric intracellular cation channel family protein [bacterium]HPP08362.1 trimeric intracellular cation channel family protein [bacterium]
MTEAYFVFLNAVGLIAFSFSGAIKGIIKELDLFGIILLGIVTALGGGAIRDIMVQKTPVMLTAPSYVLLSLVGVIAAISVKGKRNIAVYTKIFLISDAIGLASFTSTGSIIAYQSGLGMIGMIVLGMSTAIGGGIIRDILANEVPMVLNKEIYATCSLAGCIVFWACYRICDINLTSFFSMATVFVLRMLAIRYRWNLPKFS